MSKKKRKLGTHQSISMQDIQDIVKKAIESYPIVKDQFPEQFKAKDFFEYTWNLEGAFNPFMQNDNLKSLNIETIAPDKEKIDKALKDPINNEETLIGFNHYYYFANQQFKEAIERMKAMPSFNLSIKCINITNPEKDYGSKEYKKDIGIVKEFLRKIQYKNVFKEILWNALMSETCFAIFRKFENKYKLQVFPNRYAKLTGEWEYGLLYDIDLNYFMNSTVDINMFPDSIKQKFNELYKNGKQQYNPSNSIEKRNGAFGHYCQTSPLEGFTAFKFNVHHNLNVPYFTGALSEMSILALIKQLQLDQSMISAKKLLVGNVPYKKDTKSAAQTNEIAIRPSDLAKFVSTVGHSLRGSVNIVYTPVEDQKMVEYSNTDEQGYNNFLSTVSQILSGGTTNVSTQGRMNAIQTQISQNMQELIAQEFYPQCNDFLNFYVNLETTKYKFEFEYNGVNTREDKKTRQNEALMLAGKGIPSLNKIANAFNMDKFQLEAELDEYIASGISSKLQVLLNENTMNSTEGIANNSGGRPQNEQIQTDSSAETRSTGSNIERGGQV